MKTLAGNTSNVLLGMVTTVMLAVAMAPGSNPLLYAQTEEDTESSEKMEMSNTTLSLGPGGTIPSMSTPGEKTYYVFTSELEGLDEDKLKIPGDTFDVKTLVVNKGDNVTVNFYNIDDAKTERHSFTLGDPYKVNIDLGFSENGNATFTADKTGVFTYYCIYHLPIMTGKLVVLP